MRNRKLTLTVESCLENLPLVGCAVRGICSLAIKDAVELYQIELCVVEAASNIIKHAYNNQPGRFFEITVTIAENSIDFELVDNGLIGTITMTNELHFDPECPETIPESGMGLYLINQLMDEVSFTSINGQNVMHLRKTCHEYS